MKIKELKKRRDKKLISSLYFGFKDIVELKKTISEIFHNITVVIYEK